MADVARHGGADEILARPGGRDGAAISVGGVGPGADHRHVADPAPLLGGHAAGRGGGGQTPLAVQGHGADGAELALVQRGFVERGQRDRPGQGRGLGRGARRARRQGQALVAQGLQQGLPTALGKEETRLDLFQTDGGGEGLGAFADQHDVGRFLHHRARRRDRVAGAGQTGHGPRRQVGPVHYGGIQLVLAGGGEDRAASGVEQGIVLHGLNRGLNRVQR
ncbi:hypothetical protein D3C80_960450 [compost metagenome]